MTDHPVSRAWTDADDAMVSATIAGDEVRFMRAALVAKYHADVAASRSRHPAGRAGYVPLTSPPLPRYVRLGHALLAYAAALLILAGFLLGVTVRPWVAIPLVWVGCLIGLRLAVVSHRTSGEKS